MNEETACANDIYINQNAVKFSRVKMSNFRAKRPNYKTSNFTCKLLRDTEKCHHMEIQNTIDFNWFSNVFGPAQDTSYFQNEF